MQSSETETKITAVQRNIIGISMREVLLSVGSTNDLQRSWHLR